MNKSLIFIPLLILFALGFSVYKKHNAYDSFIKGVGDGINLFKDVFPSIMTMLLCVTLLKSSGLIEDFALLISNIVPGVSKFVEIIPMVLFRPVSGSASIAVLDSICKSNVDGLVCKMASTIQGSTDTTIYVLALYFTSVGVSKWKHALKAGIICDIVGISVGIILSLIFLS